MLNVVYLCAVLSGDIPCIPMVSMRACQLAASGLTQELVERAVCAEAEIIIPHSRWPSPEKSPFPKPNPRRTGQGV